jgi:hypothetical protein
MFSALLIFILKQPKPKHLDHEKKHPIFLDLSNLIINIISQREVVSRKPHHLLFEQIHQASVYRLGQGINSSLLLTIIIPSFVIEHVLQ